MPECPRYAHGANERRNSLGSLNGHTEPPSFPHSNLTRRWETGFGPHEGNGLAPSCVSGDSVTHPQCRKSATRVVSIDTSPVTLPYRQPEAHTGGEAHVRQTSQLSWAPRVSCRLGCDHLFRTHGEGNPAGGRPVLAALAESSRVRLPLTLGGSNRHPGGQGPFARASRCRSTY